LPRALIGGDIDNDNDGDVDLVATNNGGAVAVLRNDSGGGASLVVRLKGSRGNRDGIGARHRGRGRTLVAAGSEVGLELPGAE